MLSSHGQVLVLKGRLLLSSVDAAYEQCRHLLICLVHDWAASLTCVSVFHLLVVITTWHCMACCCSLDLQLSQLEASVAAADAPTLELLGQSTSRWLQADQTAATAPADTHRDAPAASTSGVGSECQPHQSSNSGMKGRAGAGNSNVANAGESPSSGL
jgi:hypothetical protein